MKKLMIVFISVVLLYSSHSASSINEGKNVIASSDSSLKEVCTSMSGTIKTGHILFHAVNHLPTTEWAGLAIRFKTIEGTLKDYRASEGKSGRGDGYNEMMYAIISQSRLLNELVDICVKGEEVLGIETYAIDL
ncbi:hypothetical protein [Enterobacter ludwigii]